MLKPSRSDKWSTSKRFLASISAIFLASCGQIRLGGTTNDAVPTGTIVASGTFSGAPVSGVTPTGATEIYSSGSGNYVLRLDNVNFPTESNLQINLNLSDANGPRVLSFLLRAYTGNQNYPFTASGAPVTFSTVALYSTQKITNYAIANLIAH